MKSLQGTKLFLAIPPASQDNAAFTSNVINTAGMAYGEFHILVGSVDAAMAVLKAMGSDTETDGTTLGGTPVEIQDATVKPGATDDNKLLVIGIDFVKNPRTEQYIQLQSTAGDGAAGTILGATFVAEMSGEVSSSERGDDVLGTDYA